MAPEASTVFVPGGTSRMDDGAIRAILPSLRRIDMAGRIFGPWPGQRVTFFRSVGVMNVLLSLGCQWSAESSCGHAFAPWHPPSDLLSDDGMSNGSLSGSELRSAAGCREPVDWPSPGEATGHDMTMTSQKRLGKRNFVGSKINFFNRTKTNGRLVRRNPSWRSIRSSAPRRRDITSRLLRYIQVTTERLRQILDSGKVGFKQVGCGGYGRTLSKVFAAA